MCWPFGLYYNNTFRTLRHCLVYVGVITVSIGRVVDAVNESIRARIRVRAFHDDFLFIGVFVQDD